MNIFSNALDNVGGFLNEVGQASQASADLFFQQKKEELGQTLVGVGANLQVEAKAAQAKAFFKNNKTLIIAFGVGLVGFIVLTRIIK